MFIIYKSTIINIIKILVYFNITESFFFVLNLEQDYETWETKEWACVLLNTLLSVLQPLLQLSQDVPLAGCDLDILAELWEQRKPPVALWDSFQ